LGIEPEARVFQDPLDVTFISGVFYPLVGSGFSFGPIMGRMLKKLFYSTRQRAPKTEAAWRSTVAESFMAFFGDAPILRVFLKRQISTCKRVESDKYQAKLLDRRPPIDWTMYMWRRYQLTWEDVRTAEAFLSHLPVSPGYIYQETLQDMVRIDTVDILERPVLGSTMYRTSS